jgi:hypothetical protein
VLAGVNPAKRLRDAALADARGEGLLLRAIRCPQRRTHCHFPNLTSGRIWRDLTAWRA